MNSLSPARKAPGGSSSCQALAHGIDQAAGTGIAAAVAGRSGKDTMAAFANAYRDYALAHPGRYVATQAVQLDPAVLAQSTVHARTIELTHAMLRAYRLVEPDLTDAGRLLRSAFHGYITLEANGGFRHSRDVQRSWARALDGLHILLENWPADSSRHTAEEERT
ncbi:TetR-like C-terminal domain-containing protein [Nonomuraea sp. H19]|uniref:TetR-like C-terminal domain-containing protein n=1 Tax=Nonomuraea sp. H19 TaxID=3452206 RepID=UPI003F896EB1